MEQMQSVLKKYSVLEKGQLLRFYSRNPQDAKNEFRRLIRDKAIAQNGKFIQAYPWRPSLCEAGETSKALWVMLSMCREDIADVEHGVDTYPFDVHFIIRDEMEYRIMVVNETTPRLCLRMADKRPDKVSYVLVAEDKKDLDGLEVPEGVPIYYALYKRPDYWGAPIIEFYSDMEMERRL